ncbi:tetratricopeptide repeat protein [Shewanella sp. 30m-9]
MSVINKMLKDLDKRQQPHGLESMATSPIAHKVNSTPKRALVLTSILSLFIGGLVVFLATGSLPSDPGLGLNANQADIQPLATNTEAVKTAEGKAEVAKTITAEQLEIKLETKPEVKAEVKAGSKLIEPAQIASTVETSTIASPIAEDFESKAAQPIETPAQVVAKREPKVKDEAKVKFKQTDSANELAASPSQMNIAPASKRSSELYSGGNMAVKEVKLSAEQLAKKQMMLATDAQQQGQHLDALTYYEAALMYNPALHQARRQAAALYYGQNKLAQAAKLLEQGQLLFPQEYEFSLLLARVLQAGGQNEQALKSLALIPNTSDLAIKKWHQQSDLAQKQKDYPVAEQSFRQLAKSEPNQGRWWMGLGYALDAQQQYTEAKLAYNQALSQGNLSAQAKVYVDNRLLQLGAY